MIYEASVDDLGLRINDVENEIGNEEVFFFPSTIKGCIKLLCGICIDAYQTIKQI